jgi:hypothetical protein
MSKNRNSTGNLASGVEAKQQPEQSEHISSSDPVSEMRRAMEAARERMKRSQAVYDLPAHVPEANAGETD